MATIDDELAMFDAEIESLVSESPATNGDGAPKKKKQRIAKPSKPSNVAPVPPQHVHAPPASGGLRPVPAPMLTNPVLPHTVLASPMMHGMVGGLMPPPVPPPFMVPGLPGMFVPHQLRANVAMSTKPTSTIESAPSLYEAEAPKNEAPKANQTVALPSDIEAVMKQKETARIQQQTEAASSSQNTKKQQKPQKFLRAGGGKIWEDRTLAEWDPNDFRIFCGDLGNEVSDELLAKAFRKYPSFTKAKVVRDSKTNKSKGFGFVSFKDSDDYIRAIREMDGKYVGNRPIKLRKSNWKERQYDVIRKKEKSKKSIGLWI